MRSLLLDRDGVINEDSPHYIKSPQEWRPLPGSLESIARANRAGLRVIVVTNQSGLARGVFDIATLNAIHRRMLDAVADVGGDIEAVFFCPHGPSDGCDCRKPKPGLLTAIRDRLGLDLSRSVLIGDKLSDVAAAHAGGVKPVLISSAGEDIDASALRAYGAVDVFPDLASAIDRLLAHA